MSENKDINSVEYVNPVSGNVCEYPSLPKDHIEKSERIENLIILFTLQRDLYKESYLIYTKE